MENDKYNYISTKRKKGKDKAKEKYEKYGKFNQKYVRLKLQQINNSTN